MYNMMMNDTRDRSLVPDGTAIWNHDVERLYRKMTGSAQMESPNVAAATLAR
jgi:hypothetical protein